MEADFEEFKLADEDRDVKIRADYPQLSMRLFVRTKRDMMTFQMLSLLIN